ncbi:hypothetical protein C8R45DRAFT_1074725 [Mycena sanguinolenta]|nr:hypothetical protein C8R45DRAFT_1074725 [Mycena sanguinolenta]
MFNKSVLWVLPFLVFFQTSSPTSATPTSRTKQTIRWVDCRDRVPDPVAKAANLTGPTWVGALPLNLHCGEMDVPMDYTREFDQVTNNITIGFAMTRPVPPAAVMKAVREKMRQPSPSTQEEFDQYTTAMKSFYDAAIRDSTPPGIMQYVGTTEVIQDFDSMRAALGYEKISFVGLSYGTFAGMAYAAKYPERVDRFVLDAVFPHGGPLQELVTPQRAAVNRLVQRTDAFCQTDPTCPFYGQGNGSVIQAWQTVLARSIQAPLPALSCGPGTDCNSPVTSSDLRQAATLHLALNPDFPLFSIGLNASLHGDASIFAYYPELDIRESVEAPLFCADFAIDDDLKTFAGFNNFGLDSTSDPLKIIYTIHWQLLLQCTVWPFPVSPSIARVTLPTDLPLMWVTSDFDLDLPTELANFAWQQAPGSTLVIRHGDDHISLLLPPPAAAAGDLARNFLRTGIMPQPSSNVNVTVIGAGGTRGPVPGAYDVPTGAVAGDISSVEDIV